MTVRCFYYAPHHPIDRMDPLSLFPEAPELCTKIFFKNICKNPLQFPERFVIIYKSHG